MKRANKMFGIIKVIISITVTVAIIFFLFWLGYKGLLGMILGMVIVVLVYEYPPLRFLTEAMANIKIK